MSGKPKQTAQNPLILHCHRLMEAFAKSDDERDFYLDRNEGFLVYVDLDKSEEELQALEQELKKHSERYCTIPKMTFYETKKIMEGFVNEKVYDIDTKEKLLDIIQSKEARQNFLEFLYDHHSELEKWQQYYQERSRIRIIEWLRSNHFYFVFEEDLDFLPSVLEKLKKQLFQSNVGKDIVNARKALIAKAKTYYSNEALNPRPKRGRPPKQVAKAEIEPKIAVDIYTTVPPPVRPFLFKPEISSSSGAIFSSKFETSEEKLLTPRRSAAPQDAVLENLQQKLASLRQLSLNWQAVEEKKPTPSTINGNDLDEEELPIDELPVPTKLKTSKKEPTLPPSKRVAKAPPLRPIRKIKPKKVKVNTKTTVTKSKSLVAKAPKSTAAKRTVAKKKPAAAAKKKPAVKKAAVKAVKKPAVKKAPVKAVKKPAAKKVVAKKTTTAAKKKPATRK